MISVSLSERAIGKQCVFEFQVYAKIWSLRYTSKFSGVNQIAFIRF